MTRGNWAKIKKLEAIFLLTWIKLSPFWHCIAFNRIIEVVKPQVSKIHAREISIQGEGDGTRCAVVNQLWAWLILNHEKYFSVKQQPILQLIDNCTCGTIPFPLYRDFPGETKVDIDLPNYLIKKSKCQKVTTVIHWYQGTKSVRKFAE